LNIRSIRPEEHAAWLELRILLWPDHTRQELAEDQRRLLRKLDHNEVFVAVLPSSELIGFAEVSVREWAEGCDTEPVGYLEGWYVQPAHRLSGIGRRLVEAAEGWALSKGCTEMGSDAELWNEAGQRAHQALGFEEANRVVCFSKKIGKAARER
jgi:aminoglycoside 6'-N-acetyltransferase I